MTTTVYIDFTENTKLQTDIMIFVDDWARNEKTPIPRAIVVAHMKAVGINEPTTRGALDTLERKGYIRRSCITSNKTFYVQLRRV